MTDRDNLFIGLLIGMLATGIFTRWTLNDMWKLDAIERGYAMYCPVDGAFAWAGECK